MIELVHLLLMKPFIPGALACLCYLDILLDLYALHLGTLSSLDLEQLIEKLQRRNDITATVRTRTELEWESVR